MGGRKFSNEGGFTSTDCKREVWHDAEQRKTRAQEKNFERRFFPHTLIQMHRDRYTETDTRRHHMECFGLVGVMEGPACLCLRGAHLSTKKKTNLPLLQRLLNKKRSVHHQADHGAYHLLPSRM